MPLRTAVIGLGKMGILHTAQLKSIPDAQIVAAADKNKQLAPYSRKVNPDIPFYSDLEKMFDSEEIDAAYICTPAFTHFDVSRLCSERKVHQFIEKPLAHTLDSAKKIMDYSPSDRVLSTGYSFAFHPVYQKVKELLDQNILGKIYRFNASTFISVVQKKQSGWLYEKEKSGGGIVINSASHLIHLLWWYFGETKHIYSQARSVHTQVEDCAFVSMEFQNGIQSMMDVSWCTPGYRLQEINITIEGYNGKMEVTNDMIKLFLKKPLSRFQKGWTTLHKIDLGDSAEFFLGSEEFNVEDKHFVDCCVNKKSPLVSGKDGLRVQRIIEGIYLSANQNKVVDMDKEIPHV